MQNFDVIIVGAGPAGSLAGYHLAAAGMDVLILEKNIFPRRKVCGGGLTHRALDELPFDVQPVIQRAVTWGYISAAGRASTAINGNDPIAYLVERAPFDSFLLDRAVEKGAHSHFKERFLNLKEEGSRLSITTPQAIYHCRYLVGADGIHSQVAKRAGLIPTRATILAYEARLKLPFNKPHHLLDSVTFDFGTLLCGYGWIFPKCDHLNVGVGRSWPGRKVAQKHLLRFIDQHPALQRDNLIDVRAYPFPLGGDEHSLHQNNILLVGDAANLADPWLGEGLYYAFTSGRMAAEAIVKHAAGQSADLSGYTQKVHATLIKIMHYARRLSLLVNSFPIINTRLLKRSPTLQAMIIELLRGSQTHQDIWMELKTQYPRLLWYLVRGK